MALVENSLLNIDNVEAFLQKYDNDPNNLFKTLPINQIKSIQLNLIEKSDKLNQKLKNLVIDNYEDLLSTADTIIEINDIIKIQDKKLNQLFNPDSEIDTNNYNNQSKDIKISSKYLNQNFNSNFNNFNKSLVNFNFKKLYRQNDLIILRNLLFNLELKLNSMVQFNKENNNINIYNYNYTENQNQNQEPNSNSKLYIDLSKIFFIIEFHFDNLLSQNENLLAKFNSLKEILFSHLTNIIQNTDITNNEFILDQNGEIDNFTNSNSIKNSNNNDNYLNSYQNNDLILNSLIAITILNKFNYFQLIQFFLIKREQKSVEFFTNTNSASINKNKNKNNKNTIKSKVDILYPNNYFNLKDFLNYNYKSIIYLVDFFKFKKFQSLLFVNLITNMNLSFLIKNFNSLSLDSWFHNNTNTEIKYTYSITQLNDSFSMDLLNNEVDSFKLKISNTILNNFNNLLNSILENKKINDDLKIQNLINLIKSIYLIFKQFNTLLNLPNPQKIESNTENIKNDININIENENEKDLFFEVLNSWRNVLLTIINEQINNLNQVTELIQSLNDKNINKSINDFDEKYDIDSDNLWSVNIQNDFRITNLDLYLNKIVNISQSNKISPSSHIDNNRSNIIFKRILSGLIGYFDQILNILKIFKFQFYNEFIINIENHSINSDENFENELMNLNYNLNLESFEKLKENSGLFNKKYHLIFENLFKKIWFNNIIDNLNKTFKNFLEFLQISKKPERNFLISENLIFNITRIVSKFNYLVNQKILLDLLALNINESNSLNTNQLNDTKEIQKLSTELLKTYFNEISSKVIIESKSELSELILQRFIPINFKQLEQPVGILSEGSLEENKSLFSILIKKLNSNDTYKLKEPVEIELWENDLPVIPSLNFSGLLQRLSENLINGNEQYLINNNKIWDSNVDLYDNDCFHEYKIKIINELLKVYENCVTFIANIYLEKMNPLVGEKKAVLNNIEVQSNEEDVNKEFGESIADEAQSPKETQSGATLKEKLSQLVVYNQVLTSYADISYLSNFVCTISKSENPILDSAETKKTLERLSTISDTFRSLNPFNLKFINKNVLEHYKHNKLLLLPLTN
ncbi:uncharacterized protein ASCRUDRAFT_6221 [Ascoidea rubescens DSM 1968]|uniref:Uncharacterized protein n=1 Tax=Ascoidea rubescens DSM 1968 TaxID=1344418 RepID=A0A1D2VS58_9ASCO|nr:hypothetical protein ASCRUDRAFT_6221 [Ascoidea rubescens DSM 1968]ODV64395.1 hypothetical protein ASCRUDRAFT_6221 [Ascoidea rubescens DSM 1968]